MADSNDIVPKPDQPTPLAIITDEQADRIGWVIGRISESLYMPAMAGLPWHGRAEIIGQAMAKFALDRKPATELVDGSVRRLWDGAGADDKHVQRATMLVRLQTMLHLLTSMMNGRRVETTYKFEKDQSGQRVRVHSKEKVVPNDANAIAGRILEINRDIAALLGLTGGSNAASESVAEILKGMAEVASQRETTVKVTAQASSKKLGAAGKQFLLEASETLRKTKRVKSKVRKPPKENE